MLGHVSPEAAVGGPIALVEEGDTIVVDVDARELNLEVDEATLAARRARLDAAAAQLHAWGAGEVRGARVVRVRGRGHERRPARPDARGPHRRLRAPEPARPMTLRISFKTSPQGVSWPVLDATWRRAGELSADGGAAAFDGGWMNDHLLDMDPSVPGPSLEAVTLLAALVHHVPGLRVGHAVLSNTFRHPVLVAKAATVMDHATNGNFVLGLGAGWFENEHGPFGIELPPIGERISRLESAVGHDPGPVRPRRRGRARRHPRRPVLPAPRRHEPADAVTPGGPPLFLGGQGPRGIRLAARAAQGWLLPGTEAGDDAYFGAKRDLIRRGPRGRGPRPGHVRARGAGVTRAPTPPAGRGRSSRPGGSSAAGASEIVLGMPAALGPAGLETSTATCSSRSATAAA